MRKEFCTETNNRINTLVDSNRQWHTNCPVGNGARTVCSYLLPCKCWES